MTLATYKDVLCGKKWFVSVVNARIRVFTWFDAELYFSTVSHTNGLESTAVGLFQFAQPLPLH